MAGPNLKQTFEEATEPSEMADAFHKYLSQYHPLDHVNSDRLQKLIDQFPDGVRKERLITLRDFLSIYHVGEMKGKPSKHWDVQINILTQLTNDFIATKNQRPHSLPQLLEYMIDITGDDLRLHFNAKSGQNELSYEAVYSRVSKKFDGKNRKIPLAAKELHDFTYGDRSSLVLWLKDAKSRKSKDTLSKKIDHYARRYQFNAVADILVLSAGFRAFLPATTTAALEKKRKINPNEIKYAKQLNWQHDLLLGITPIFSEEKIAHKFKPETYKKIRNFLAYEYGNIRELNRAAALMTLIFPEYNDFTKYVLNKASYNSRTQKMDLAKLIDTSNFHFQDNDYTAWGELLLDQGPSRFFYLKTAHLLSDIPRNEKNKILISRLDRQLYDKIADLVGFCSKHDCSRYDELKIVRDILSIQKFKNECRADTEHMPDKASYIPEMNIDGERFGKPGYSFRRLPYNDDRFFVVGRFTKSCEYIDGEWGATVQEGYKNRASTYYCLFDPNNKIIAHTWVYIDPDDWGRIILDGFEADQNDEIVSKVLLEKIVEEMNKDVTNKTFVIGTSAPHLNLEQITTIKRGEEHRDHIKVVNPEDLLNLDRLIADAKMPVFHANPKETDSEILKAASIPTLYSQKPKDP